MTRALTPDDLYRILVPTSPRLSPDGAIAVFTVQAVAPAHDGYRHAVWSAPLDGSAPARPITLGARHDRAARFSPDGTRIAFVSDRRLIVEEEPERGPVADREDGAQVYVLPVAGGEARRLTDLPRGVDGLEWSPDGRSLVVLSTSHGATRTEDARRRGKTARPRPPGSPPESDYRYIDRLEYMLNGAGFTYDRIAQLWLVDATSGAARRLTSGRTAVASPAWSPDGSRIAFTSDRGPDADLHYRSDVFVVDVATGAITQVTSGPGERYFEAPTWLPDGQTLACLGHRFPAADGSRNDVWLFAADGTETGRAGGRNLTARHDLMPGSAMNSDIVPGEGARLAVSADGRRITFTAPIEGSYELWRVTVGDGAIERLTTDRHFVSSFDQVDRPDGGTRIACLRSSATSLSDLHVLDLPAAGRRAGFSAAAASGPRPKLRPITALNEPTISGIELVPPIERRVQVDGRSIQGWYLPPAGVASGTPAGEASGTAAPLVTEIHGGPHTLYGYAPVLEFQVLAAAGIGVFYANPRGSEGYGQDFNAANFRDWGPGPMRDVLAGIESLVADGLARADRLGLTGGSYGGYLTTWMIAHDARFAAAITCRSVSDMAVLMLTGDISGGMFSRLEFGTAPWEEPDYFREISPLTHAPRIRTPLLIQHAENDLRCTITQAEALFSVLRAHRLPVRLMRVPGESHELTRSGTPFRRAENLVQVRDWFRHYLVRGGRGLPPLPRNRAGR